MSERLLKRFIISLLFIISIILSISPIALKIVTGITNLLDKSINITLWSYRFSHYFIFFAFLFFTVLLCISFNFKIIFKDFKFKPFFKYFFIFTSSLLILFFTSTTSPFYPYHIWDDSNCFFTVGNNILNGLVPYKDLVEQKGPLLYFLHAFASIISRTSFFGVFIIQVISLSIFSIFILKILSLFTDKNIIFLIPFINAIFFTSKNYILGDSAEELCLIFLIYPMYCSIKNIISNQDYSIKELFLIGICAGCVLWIKYTMCFYFIGWAIIPIYIYIKKSNIKGIFFSFLFIVSGIIITTIPFIIYFSINNALSDLFQVYFYNNIFLYGNSSSIKDILISFITNIIKWLLNNPKLLFLFILSIYCLLKKHNNIISLSIFFSFVSLSLGIFIGGNVQPYYSFILDIFLIFSLLPIHNYLSKKSLSFEIAFTPILAIIFFFCFAQYSYISKIKKNDLPHFIISNYINNYDNPTILEYGSLANGFYTLCNIKPITKYFCTLNIPLQEMLDEQELIVNQGKVDFVITWDSELESEKYELILKKDVYLRTNNTCYLYKNINIKEPIND